jgi:hypothetical protein
MQRKNKFNHYQANFSLLALLLLFAVLSWAATTQFNTTFRACGPEIGCGTCPDVCSDTCVSCTTTEPTNTNNTNGPGRRIINSPNMDTVSEPPVNGFSSLDNCSSLETCTTYCNLNPETCDSYFLTGLDCGTMSVCLQECKAQGAACDETALFDLVPEAELAIGHAPDANVVAYRLQVGQTTPITLNVTNNEAHTIEYIIDVKISRNNIMLLEKRITTVLAGNGSASFTLAENFEPKEPGILLAQIDLQSPLDSGFAMTQFNKPEVLGTASFELGLFCSPKVLRLGESTTAALTVRNLGAWMANLNLVWITEDNEENEIDRRTNSFLLLPLQTNALREVISIPGTEQLGEYLVLVEVGTGNEIRKVGCTVIVESEEEYYSTTILIIEAEFEKATALAIQEQGTRGITPELKTEMDEIRTQISLLKAQFENQELGAFGQTADQVLIRTNSLQSALLVAEKGEDRDTPIGVVAYLIVGIIALVTLLKVATLVASRMKIKQ